MSNSYLYMLIPLIVLQLAFQIYTIVHIAKHRSYKFGNLWVWIIICCLFGFVGPIVYFVFGRSRS